MRWQNWLLIAALADWLIGRTLSRAAIFMPKTGVMVGVAQALTFVGQVAFNLASILTLAAIAALAIRGFSRTERNLPRSVALVGLIGLSIVGMIVPPSPAALLLFHVFTLAALITISVRAGSRLAVVVPALAIASMALFKIDQAVASLSGRPAQSAIALAAFQVGELFVVLSPVAVWWLHGRGGRAREWTVAAIPAMLFAIGYVANPSLTATMAMWSVGLSLYLPWPVYAVSLWAATLTIIRAIHAGQLAGYGLAFLLCAGYTAQLSSQVMLGLLGVWMLGAKRVSKFPAQSIPSQRSESSPVVA